ncbi:MAG: AMP-binding protein [Thermoleophilaceae bacterium]|nr:AMP-binding protein [Thermoleophilaceae bacterium]
MKNPLASKAFTVKVLARSGVLKPVRPDRLARLGVAYLRWGATPATGAIANALRRPNDLAIIDDEGSLTWRELHVRTNKLAHALADEGVGEGDGVALLARNHRFFIESTVAVSKLGGNSLFLNTSFAGPQAAGVLEREKPRAVIYDAEFLDLIDEATEGRQLKRFVALEVDGDPTPPAKDRRLEDLILEGDPAEPVAPKENGKIVILTSGTTGTPKGATRGAPKSLDPVAAMLDRVPLKAEERTLIAAPLFHAWGAAHFQIALPLGSTIVLQRKFDPERTLQAIDRERPSLMAVVPVMLARILDLPEETIKKYDLSSLRVVMASGSALHAKLANKWMDATGENLYNLYGSTEVAWAAIATPQDMRSAPGTVGKPPHGTDVVIFGEGDKRLPTGETGRIFVWNDLLFEGYTGGSGSKQELEGMMSTGDVGHIDEENRLFVDSREDDMIVSGGENVYPGEVEDLLMGHDAVEEAAVIGVEDEQFGARLKAVVVKAKGKSIDDAALKEHVKKNLARYKVPRDVEFVDELPRNATGKILKRELVEKEGTK